MSESNNVTAYVPNAVERYIKEKEMISKGDRVLCALSGGGDSVALLHILLELSQKLGFSVCAAHFNHRIRGAEADRDEEFSRSLCESLSVPFLSGSEDVPMLANQSGEGLEECARRLRYGFLFGAMETLACNKLATAHHSTDNAETVIFHLFRGSGINGLGGIAPVRKDSVIRPLLCISRADIDEYLQDNFLGFVTDSTNSDTDMTRNFIRAKMLPLAKEINPAAERAISRLSEAAREDEEYLLSLAEGVSDTASLSELAALPLPVLKRYLIIRYGRFTGGGAQLEYDRLLEICRAVRSEKKRFRIALAGRVAAVGERDSLFFITDKVRPEPFFIPLPCAGEYKTENGNIFVTESEKELSDWSKRYPNAKKISYPFGFGSIAARSRREGDKYLRGGMRRAVRKELNAIGYPAFKRDSLPVFCDSDGIFWVPGLPPRDGVSCSEKTKQLIYIGYTEN